MSMEFRSPWPPPSRITSSSASVTAYGHPRRRATMRMARSLYPARPATQKGVGSWMGRIHMSTSYTPGDKPVGGNQNRDGGAQQIHLPVNDRHPQQRQAEHCDNRQNGDGPLHRPAQEHEQPDIARSEHRVEAHEQPIDRFGAIHSQPAVQINSGDRG